MRVVPQAELVRAKAVLLKDKDKDGVVDAETKKKLAPLLREAEGIERLARLKADS